MHIERFDAETDRDLVRACHEMHVAAAPVDVPGEPPMSDRVFAGWLRMYWTEDRPETWLARDAAGMAEASRVLHLRAIPDGHLARLRERARAAGGGYALLSWAGPAPERYIEQ